MKRRNFLKSSAAMMAAMAAHPAASSRGEPSAGPEVDSRDRVTLFFGGDVMTGRGVDQILPHPSDPVLYEKYVSSALEYVALAEEESGPLPREVDYDYVWGDAMDVLQAAAPDFRIANLETCVTTSSQPWPGKGIHFRMHPDNGTVLTAAGFDCLALANNHILDWSAPGLEQTVEVLHAAGIKTAGAGRNAEEALAPAEFDLPGGGKLRFYSAGSSGAGVSRKWAAKADRPGVQHLGWLDPDISRVVEDRIRRDKQPGDLAVASIHWGGNWGYEAPRDQRTFARRLIEAGADVVHGHSSHHPRGIEVYRDRPVIYGAGDLINDYEGIVNRADDFRGELTLLYLVTLETGTGALRRLRLHPMRVRKFRLQHATRSESDWLFEMLNREGGKLNTDVRRTESRFELGWR